MVLARLFGRWLALPAPLLVPFGTLLGGLVGATQQRNLDEARGGLEIGFLGEMMVGGAMGALLGALPGLISGMLSGIANGIVQGSLGTLLFGIVFGVLFSVFPSAAFGAVTGAGVAAVIRILGAIWPPPHTVPAGRWVTWPYWLMAAMSLLLLVGTGAQSGLKDCGWLDVSLSRGACRYQFDAGEEVARGIAFDASNGDLLVADSAGSVHRWRLSNGSLVETSPVDTGEATVISALFPDGGGPLILGSNDNRVRIVNAAGRVERTLAGHETAVTALALAPDGSLLASGANDRTIRLWDPAGGAPLAVLTGHEAGIADLAFNPDGGLLVSAGLDETVRLWQLPAGTLVHTLRGHEGGVRAVTFSADGSEVISGANDGTVRRWRSSDGTLLATIVTGGTAVRALALSPEGVLATGSDDGAVYLWPDSGVELGSVSAPITRLVFSPDGRFVATATSDGAVQVWTIPE
jgi:hypothetical protein